MKVKVIHKFTDKYTGEHYSKGDVLYITKERFEEILSVAPLVQLIAQDDVEAPSAGDATNTSNDTEEPTETDSSASDDAFDTMSVRELKEYADKAYKMTFKSGTKKSEIIDTLRRMERGNK